MRYGKRIAAALGASVIAFTTIAPAAFADALFVDGDSTHDGINNWSTPLNLGDICVGKTKSSGNGNAEIDVALRRASAATNTFNVYGDGAQVVRIGGPDNVTAAYGSQVTSTGDSIILPADWYTNKTRWAGQLAPSVAHPVIHVTAGNRVGLDYLTAEFRSEGVSAAGTNYITRRTLLLQWNVVDDASCHSDTTAPNISYSVNPSTPDGDNGWYTGDANIEWTVSDAESAILDRAFECTDTVANTINYDTNGASVTCWATSSGGRASVTSDPIKRDSTAPVITWDETSPADGATYAVGSVPTANAWTCTAWDQISGVNADGCTITGYSALSGTHALMATAKDQAGNTVTSTRYYTVEPWKISGFYNPVSMDKVNTIKGGQNVTLKFNVTASGTPITDPSALGAAFTQSMVPCGPTGVFGPVTPMTTTGGTTLRYDADSQQFVMNWKTPKDAGKCYVVSMSTADGSLTSAAFSLK